MAPSRLAKQRHPPTRIAWCFRQSIQQGPGVGSGLYSECSRWLHPVIAGEGRCRKRLLYVAMSRAKNYLTLMVPQRVVCWRHNTSVVDLLRHRTNFIPN
jgi:hypothetical protein